MKNPSFRLCHVLVVGFFLAGCQPQSKTSPILLQHLDRVEPISIETWLANSEMPLMQDAQMDGAEVAYVLRKTGFDPAPSEVAPWIGKNRSELVSYLLNSLESEPVVDVPPWTASQPRYWGQRDWPETRKRAFRSSRQQEIGELRQWWIKQMLATQSPLGERLVLMWENTFVVGFSGLDNKSHAQWFHHQTIRDRAAGNYRALVLSMMRDPGVLIYLDNNRNKKESPNENLARELFELYTLGESNYSEKDIKESARTLAGWHVSEFGEIKFQEKSWARDYGIKKIFGESGKFDGEDLVDLILRHPASAKYVVQRFWQEFVSSEPMPEEIKLAWADGFRSSDYEIEFLLEIVLTSDIFWNSSYRATSVKSPVEFLIGSLRFAQTNKLPVSVIDSSLSAMGQTLFDPPDVSGWGYGEYWLDPGFIIERERVQQLLKETLNVSSISMEQVQREPKNRIVYLKLAGEAYKGPPPYRVIVKHSGGSWSSSEMLLHSARDTERLGRYLDESQWVWDTVEVELPPDVEKVTSISVLFPRDAAGNGGDRNLFVGAVALEGTIVPGASGTQYPGCRNDRVAGFIKYPDRLYCQGAIEYDWLLATNLKKVSRVSQRESGTNLVTKELVLRWLKPPSEGKWQGIDLMLDGLEYQGRRWDYFGFKLALDERKRWYQLSIDEDRCEPSCLEKWPPTAWKDKSGLRHVNIYFNNYESWAREQYFGLTEKDRNLVKALLSTAPIIRDLVQQTKAHQEPDSKQVWDERMAKFVEYSESSNWKLEPPPGLVQTELSAKTDVTAMMSMGGMSTMSIGTERYANANVIRQTPAEWHQNLETYLVLASEPLESWTLSGHEGDRILEMQDVLVNPYWNLK